MKSSIWEKENLEDMKLKSLRILDSLINDFENLTNKRNYDSLVDLIAKKTQRIDQFQRRYISKKHHIKVNQTVNKILTLLDQLSIKKIQIEDSAEENIEKALTDVNISSELDNILGGLYKFEKILRKNLDKDRKESSSISVFGILTVSLSKREAWMTLLGFIIGTLTTVGWLVPILI